MPRPGVSEAPSRVCLPAWPGHPPRACAREDSWTSSVVGEDQGGWDRNDHLAPGHLTGRWPPTDESGAHMFNDNGSFLLALFEFFLWFAWFMCLFWIFGDLFRSRDLGGGAKTLWVLFV